MSVEDDLFMILEDDSLFKSDWKHNFWSFDFQSLEVEEESELLPRMRFQNSKELCVPL